MQPSEMPTAATGTAVTGTRRRRGPLAGLALVLACLTIVLATVAVWVHQAALDTERFTAIVTNVVDDPAFTDPIAAKVSQQVVTALDVEGRIAARLPDAAKSLAGTMTVAVQEAIDRQLRNALDNPRVQQGLLTSLSFTHERVVRFLRGDSTAITIRDGYAQLNIFPVIGAALTELQSIGLIPADVALPDLSSDDAPEALADRLEARLGITLPPDFGTIPLMEAQRLSTAQTIVQAFDIIVVALIILAVLLVLLTVWLARDRRRMVVYVGIGTIVALIVARFAVRGVSSAIVDGIADQGIAGALRVVVDSVVTDLIGLTTIVLVVTAALCIVAYVAGRPAWLVRLSRRSAGAVTSTASGVASSAAATGRTDLAPAVRDHRSTLERLGIAAIVFAVAWIAIGFEVALLGAALVGAWLLIVHIVAGEPADTAPVAPAPDGAAADPAGSDGAAPGPA